MAVKLHTSDLLIFEKRNDVFEYEKTNFADLMYYFIKDYQYDKNNKLEWVVIEVIIDVKEYFSGENKDTYTLTLNKRISDDIRKDVDYYKSKKSKAF